VVGAATVLRGSTESSSAGYYGGIGHEESDGVVVSWGAVRGHLDELVVSWGPHLWGELVADIVEGPSVVLAASDEDIAIREDNSVVEDTREPHGVDGLDIDGVTWREELV
jgi:hypothetical protein